MNDFWQRAESTLDRDAIRAQILNIGDDLLGDFFAGHNQRNTGRIGEYDLPGDASGTLGETNGFIRHVFGSTDSHLHHALLY